ncbi:MAG: glucosaminidase domain-containing protein [Clostridia bacterium]|nr:glucosaminidase domain-containing protein [Clostridia bacterium]
MAICLTILAILVLFLSIQIGLSIFGIEVFGAELPSIEEPCGLSTEELEAVLKGELKNHAQAFLHAEEDYHINALFLCAVAAAESGWGEHCFRPNNFFGFMTNKEFSSPEECIDFVAWWLRKHYLNEHGRYYRGGTIEAIGKIWCPDDGEWVRLVTGIYGGLCR